MQLRLAVVLAVQAEKAGQDGVSVEQLRGKCQCRRQLDEIAGPPGAQRFRARGLVHGPVELVPLARSPGTS